MKLLYSRVPLFMMLTLMTLPPAAALPTMTALDITIAQHATLPRRVGDF